MVKGVLCRLLGGRLNSIILLTVLGFIVVACGGETANEEDRDEGDTPQTSETGDQEEVWAALPGFPSAPSDNENPRLRGSQQLTQQEFLQFVVNDASAKWQGYVEAAGFAYSRPGLIALDQAMNSPCGPIRPAGGPLYCFEDQTVYFPVNWVVPTSGKPLQEYGDFAIAQVAAHEVGHHVQERMGILGAKRRGEYDTDSLQTELQADCFAGAWGYSVFYQGAIESGDLDEAVELLGDVPSPPEMPRGGPGAHGTSEERTQAFLTGYDYGEPFRCLDYAPLPNDGAKKR